MIEDVDVNIKEVVNCGRHGSPQDPKLNTPYHLMLFQRFSSSWYEFCIQE